MAISSKYDPELGILFTTADGLLTLDAVLRHLDAEDRGNEIGYAELFDATQAQTDLTSEQVRELLKRVIEIRDRGGFGATAVICANDVLYGMASMLGILSELGGGPQIQAFRSFDEGINWLVRVKGQEYAQ